MAELHATGRVKRNYHRIDPDDELAKGGCHLRPDGDLRPCLGAHLKHYKSLNVHDQRSTLAAFANRWFATAGRRKPRPAITGNDASPPKTAMPTTTNETRAESPDHGNANTTTITTTVTEARVEATADGEAIHHQGSHGGMNFDLHEKNECRCGQTEPSGPHIIWTCSAYHEQRAARDLASPHHRAEERLLVPCISQYTGPCRPPDHDKERATRRTDLANTIVQRMDNLDSLYLATGGSYKDGVAASAITMDHCGWTITITNEEASSFIAEIAALKLLLEANIEATTLGARGHITAYVDCTAALDMCSGRPTSMTRHDRFRLTRRPWTQRSSAPTSG